MAVSGPSGALPRRTAGERQYRAIRLNPRRAADHHALREQPIVPHDLGLLFEPIAGERPAGPQAVAVRREGVAHQHEIPAPARLRLPDMRHFMDERSEEHTSELQSLMRISYAVFCLK